MGIYDGSHEKSISTSNESTRGVFGWDMGGHKIVNAKTPNTTSDHNSVPTVQFLNENFLHKKMNSTLTSSTFSNTLDGVSINMLGNRLFGLPGLPLLESDAVSLGYLRSHVYNSLSETLLWEYYTRYGTSLYKLDRGNSAEVVMDSTTRKVSKLYDQTLYENYAEQTTSANQPTLSTSANRINNRYYLNFNGSQRMLSNIDLNVARGYVKYFYCL